MKALNTLVEMLGYEGSQRFLTVALPQLQQYRQDLLGALQQHNWQLASNLAHRLKATAYLYSSPIFQDCLDRIIAQDIAQLRQTAFQARLETEFTYTENEITRFLCTE